MADVNVEKEMQEVVVLGSGTVEEARLEDV
jgi:hypothetical protein